MGLWAHPPTAVTARGTSLTGLLCEPLYLLAPQPDDPRVPHSEYEMELHPGGREPAPGHPGPPPVPRTLLDFSCANPSNIQNLLLGHTVPKEKNQVCKLQHARHREGEARRRLNRCNGRTPSTPAEGWPRPLPLPLLSAPSPFPPPQNHWLKGLRHVSLALRISMKTKKKIRGKSTLSVGADQLPGVLKLPFRC